MIKVIILSMFFPLSFHALANTNVNEDVLFQKLGIIDSEFKYMDMNLANKVFKNANDRTAKLMPYSPNNLIEITSITMTPYRTIINFSNTFGVSEDNQNKFAQFLKTQESVKDWCGEHFKYRYMRVNNLKVEVNFQDRTGKTLESITLDRETCS